MNKKALVLTYHVKKSKREGGFHSLILYLEHLSYDIDWVVIPLSFSWVFHNSDRENKRNFFELWKGIEVKENNIQIRHFGVPLFLPAKLMRLIDSEYADHYWPKWKRILRSLKKDYDVILVEGVGAQYAKELKAAYPNARLIYRPSDILSTFSLAKDADRIEQEMIECSDVCYCVDENQLLYYKNFVQNKEKLKILRNPVASEEDIRFINTWCPSVISEKKTVVYIGVSFIDIELIEKTAKNIPEAKFVIIGPFHLQSHDNIVYTGALSPDQYTVYLEKANVGVVPIKHSDKTKYGYTKKIILYMKYLLPIVATCSDNYMNVKGYQVAEDGQHFIDLVRKMLYLSCQERLDLKSDYVRVMEAFLNIKCEKQFSLAVEEGIF